MNRTARYGPTRTGDGPREAGGRGLREVCVSRRCDRACACARAWAQARRVVWAYGVAGGLHRQFERSARHLRRPYYTIDGGEDGAERERWGVRKVAAAEVRGRSEPTSIRWVKVGTANF